MEVIDAERIEALMKSGVQMEISPYALSVADVLAPPSIWHPIKRYKWRRDFDRRVNFVLAEYAVSVVDHIYTRQHN